MNFLKNDYRKRNRVRESQSVRCTNTNKYRKRNGITEDSDFSVNRKLLEVSEETFGHDH